MLPVYANDVAAKSLAMDFSSRRAIGYLFLTRYVSSEFLLCVVSLALFLWLVYSLVPSASAASRRYLVKYTLDSAVDLLEVTLCKMP